MVVTFHIPGSLLSLTGGTRSVHLQLSPSSLRQALNALFEVYPGLRDRILNEQGSMREHINLFVDKEDIRYLEGLDTRLTNEVEVSIVPAVSGGSYCRESAHSRLR